MRASILAVWALLASGCTIHVVGQAAEPTVMTTAAAPAAEPPHAGPPVCHHHYPTQQPAVAAAPRDASPRVGLTPDRRRPTRLTDRATSNAPAERPNRVPFKSVAPETRSTEMARITPPLRHRRPQKVKRPEPLTRVSSASITQAQ